MIVNDAAEMSNPLVSSVSQAPNTLDILCPTKQLSVFLRCVEETKKMLPF